MRVKKAFINFFSIFFCYSAIILLLLFSSEISAGAKKGIGLCFEIIIPSMLLFMILSSMITGSSLKFAVAKPFKPIKKLLRLSDCEISVLLLSLIGGYPVGARLLAKEVKAGNITSDKATKMLSFCVNGSPAFLITGIGLGIFSSLKAGIYLYAAQVISCFFTAWIVSFFYKPLPRNEISRNDVSNKMPISSLIIDSVTDSVKAMSTICGLTISFSAIMPLISKLPIDNTISLFFKGLLEVTSGCSEIMGFSNQTTLLIVSLFCSFGGICVFLQLCAMLRSHNEKKISMKWFFALRVVNVLTVLGVTQILSEISPIKGVLLSNAVMSASANNITESAHFFTNSPVASLLLLFLSIMLLFFNKKSARI